MFYENNTIFIIFLIQKILEEDWCIWFKNEDSSFKYKLQLIYV